MRVKVDPNGIALTLFAVESVAIADWTEKTAFGTDEKKTAPDGRQLFNTRKTIIAMGENGQEKGVSFTVLEPVELTEMGKYKPAGAIWYTPWVNNGRIADSLIFEKLVPVKETPDRG